MRFSLFFLFLFISSTLWAGEWGLNLHGLSYHPDRRDSEGKKFNEINGGLGANYIFHNSHHTLAVTEAGFYVNSQSNLTEYASLSWRYKLGTRWSLGAGASFFYSPSYNHGDPFVAPFPVLAFRVKRLALQSIYFPKYKKANENSVFGLYATIYFPRKN
jgi:hypothetical protein